MDILLYICSNRQGMTELEKKKLCKQLGKNIQSARKKADFTQIKFANLLELSRPSIVNIENGRQLPPLFVIYDIAKILKIPIADLLANISATDKPSEMEKSSKKIFDDWKKSDPEEHSDDTISTVEEFIKDTNQIPNE